MDNDFSDLDQLQKAYRDRVEEWIGAIRAEEALASVTHSVAAIDTWEAAHFHEDDLRNKVKSAKAAYEGALRREFFDF
jgi:hypothetical protein